MEMMEQFQASNTLTYAMEIKFVKPVYYNSNVFYATSLKSQKNAECVKINKFSI